MEAERTVLISFLGSTDYTSCNYQLNNQRVNRVPYIQIALAEFFIKSHPDNRIILLLTDTARRSNWENESKKTLKDHLGERGLISQTEIVAIPEGKEETEIWDIFNLMFTSIRDNDRVIIDITHSFRSLPLLGVVFADYAEFLKDIRVEKICYGAFDILGNIAEVESMPADKRNVPILDLKSFNHLQKWSFAAGTFINYGIIRVLINLLEEEIARGTVVDDKYRKDILYLSQKLDKLERIFITVRLRSIYEGNIFSEISAAIEKLSENEKRFKALLPILIKIKEKIETYTKCSILNCFRAVEWYIENRMIQQGFTLLQESILAYFSQHHAQDEDIFSTELITLVKLAFKRSKANSILHEKYLTGIMREYVNTRYIKLSSDQEKEKYRAILIDLLNDPKLTRMRSTYRSIKNKRDDLNHGGSFRDIEIDYLSDLKKSYERTCSILFEDDQNDGTKNRVE